MSKSLRRVTDALRQAGLDVTPLEMAAETRTAAQAAAAAGCTLDQIAKSIVFQAADSGAVVLFITAGGRQVDPDRAAQVAGTALVRADAAAVRTRTGFAIGGVSPVGHLTPVEAFMDAHLMAFDTVWAAAGTPRHIFEVAPTDLLRVSGATVADFTRD
ncbi:MAG: YbaK/EbsC family protein [Alphaproteobacteria bacterium]|nr:YbaK/EbsC family protein [Alphaproteobacteria bacterium]